MAAQVCFLVAARSLGAASTLMPMTITPTTKERRALAGNGTRTLGGLPILWHDGDVVHACVAGRMHNDVRLVRTLCDQAVPADAAFVSGALQVGCPSCLARTAQLEPPERR
jgi:hypothetical protein